MKGINRRTLCQLKRLFGVEYLERAIAFSESDLVQGRKHGPGIPLLNRRKHGPGISLLNRRKHSPGIPLLNRRKHGPGIPLLNKESQDCQ